MKYPQRKKFSNVEDIIDLQMAGKVEEAHDAYVAYFTEHDVNSEAFTLFGLCCVTLGKIEKARKIFEYYYFFAARFCPALFSSHSIDGETR